MEGEREGDVKQRRSAHTAVHTVDGREAERVREQGFSEAEGGMGEERGRMDGMDGETAAEKEKEETSEKDGVVGSAWGETGWSREVNVATKKSS